MSFKVRIGYSGKYNILARRYLHMSNERAKSHNRAAIVLTVEKSLPFTEPMAKAIVNGSTDAHSTIRASSWSHSTSWWQVLAVTVDTRKGSQSNGICSTHNSMRNRLACDIFDYVILIAFQSY